MVPSEFLCKQLSKRIQVIVIMHRNAAALVLLILALSVINSALENRDSVE